jgi:phage shock protein E
MNYQNLLLAAILLVFIAFRFYQNTKRKKEIPSLIEKGAVIIDVRTNEEFKNGHNEKSQNIPLSHFEKEIHKLDKNIPYILCCASGGRSSMAKNIMKKNHFKNVYNAGPWKNTITN